MTSTRIFVKEMSFRSEKRENLDLVLKNFKEAQKNIKQKELDGEAGASKRGGPGGLEKLQTVRQGFPCLKDLNMRPTMATGSRRTVGTLEAHTNGFAFTLRAVNERVEVLYSQIRHIIFEPAATNSLVILIHLHLHEPMQVGKRRTQDIQFFTEVGTQTEDLSMKKSGSAYDPDEIMEEQREREMRERLNKFFKDFASKVQQLPTFPLKFDVPFPDFAFSGVPHKGVVQLAFGKTCLMSLQEWPPVVIDMSDVDIVVFERAIEALREFDITLVRKNFDEAPTRITTIPKMYLDKIKKYFDVSQTVWFISTMNFNWSGLMRDINADRRQFVANGGWNQFFADAGGSGLQDGEEDDEENSNEDDWNGSASGDDDDDDEDDEASDFSDGAEEDEPASSEPAASDGEEGMDWDELEQQAERDDKKKGDGKRERSRSQDKKRHAAPRQAKRPRR